LGGLYTAVGRHSDACRTYELGVQMAIEGDAGESPVAMFDVYSDLLTSLVVFGDYNQALDCCDRCLLLSSRMQDREYAADKEREVILKRGEIYMLQGHFDEALIEFEKYDTNGVTNLNWMQRHEVQADIYLRTGQALKALQIYRNYLNEVRRVSRNTEEGHPQIWVNLGVAHLQVGDIYNSVVALRKGLDIAIRTEALFSQSYARLALGQIHIQMDELDQAMHEYGLCSALAERLDDARLKGIVLLDEARLMARQVKKELGKTSIGFDKVLSKIEDAVGYLQVLEDSALLAEAHVEFGITLMSLERFDEAKIKLIRAIEMYEKLERSTGDRDTVRVSIFETQNRAFMSLVTCFTRLGQAREAVCVAELSKSRALLHQFSTSGSKTLKHSNLNEPYTGQAIGSEAQGEGMSLQKAIEDTWACICAASKVQDTTIVQYLCLGNSVVAAWLIPKGCERESDLKFHTIDIFKAQQEAMLAPANTETGFSMLASSLVEIGCEYDEADLLWLMVEFTRTTIELGHDLRGVYDDRVLSPNEVNNVVKALHSFAAEKELLGLHFRCLVFHFLMHHKDVGGDAFKGKNSEAVTRQHVVDILSGIEKGSRNNNPENPIPMHLDIIQQAWFEMLFIRKWLTRLEERFRMQHEIDTAMSDADNEFWDICRDPSKSGLWLWADLKSQCINPSIMHEFFSSSLRMLMDDNAHLHGLHRILLEPLLKYVEAEQELLIVPSRSLMMIPWPALRDDKSNFLIQKHPIRISPSIRFAAAASANSKKGVEELSSAAQSSGQIFIVGDPKRTDCYHSLRQAENEANDVEEMIRNASANGELAEGRKIVKLCGPDATVDATVTNLIGSHWVHFACHASVQPAALRLAMPENHGPKVSVVSVPQHLTSYDVLRRSNSSTKGTLYLETLVRQNVKLATGSTVVLSCCSSGRGRSMAEGVIGLSRGFLLSGASATVVTLWDTGDKDARVFMHSFYDALQSGSTTVAAMRKTMLLGL